MLCHKANTCRICQSSQLRTVLDLGDMALTGRFPASDEPDPPKAPLLLVRCDNCGLVQLGHEFDPNDLYRSTYGYRSGVNVTMTNHLASVARDLEQRVGLKSGDVVLDIASNDGTLLKSYSVAGLERVGIDPTIAQYGKYYDAGIKTVADFFSADNFRKACPGKKARAITSIAVFYDISNPAAFVAEIASILGNDGVWVLEQSDLGMMLEAHSFDTVCHEHLEYYGFAQIRRLIEATKLKLFDVQFNAINGGSARFYVCHADAPYEINEKNISQAVQREKTLRLDTLHPFESFRDGATKVRAELLNFLEIEVARGKVIHAYGASTKGNVLLQYCSVDNRLVQAAADRNPDKWGRRTPATNIPIISEDESRAAKPDYYLVLPWHFRDEFVKREAEFLKRGGKLVFPLPAFEVVGSEAI